jgi:hypothetical protein
MSKYTIENCKIVPLFKMLDHQAGVNSAGIYAAGAHHITAIISGATQTDGNARVTTKVGTAHGTMAANIKPRVYMSGAAAGAVGADAYTELSYVDGEDYWLIPDNNDRTYVIEIPCDMIPAGNEWLRVEVGNQGARTDISAVAVVYPRHKPSPSLARLA